MTTTEYAYRYRQALLNDIMPFWERHSPDRENGGYFTCLNRDGTVYDTDKFIWLQARQVWTFAMLYNRLEKKEAWLEAALHGYAFLKKFGRDREGNWYFSLTREGRPLVQPYNIFSDCFAAMALSQYALAAGDDEARAIALETYRNITGRFKNPKGKYNKTVPGTRDTRSFALPMIMANLVSELEPVLPADQATTDRRKYVSDVLDTFLNPETGLIHEHAAGPGNFPDTHDGRLLCPGHALEAMWFILDMAGGTGKAVLVGQVSDIILKTLESGWDKDHGGLFYFMDALGKPPLQLEWDRKLWWVHLEALIAAAFARQLTGKKIFMDWFIRLHDYAWDRFPDPDYGEWYGYLDREGKPFLQLKGGKWKGCFHLPRALFRCTDILERIKE